MIESIKGARDEIQAEINIEEEEKRQIDEQMRILNSRLEELKHSLGKKYQARNEYDKTIGDTEGAFTKILESSQTLLHVLKKEGATLQKKKIAVTTPMVTLKK